MEQGTGISRSTLDWRGEAYQYAKVGWVAGTMLNHLRFTEYSSLFLTESPTT